MTELSFLVDLLINQKPKDFKRLITERIKEIELAPRALVKTNQIPAHLAGQSPSTIANLMKDPVEAPQVAINSPAAHAALVQRQEAIAQAMSGKVEKGRTSPRKF
jgi:hypothetical protein